MSTLKKKEKKKEWLYSLQRAETGIYTAVVREQAFKVLLGAEQLWETVMPGKKMEWISFKEKLSPFHRYTHKTHTHQWELVYAKDPAISHINSLTAYILESTLNHNKTLFLPPPFFFFLKLLILYSHTFSVSDVSAYLAPLSLGDLAASQYRETFLGKR